MKFLGFEYTEGVEQDKGGEKIEFRNTRYMEEGEWQLCVVRTFQVWFCLCRVKSSP